MDKGKQKDGWMSVPEFGGWNQKAGGATDYSMVFSRARANRKQHKSDLTRRSLGNEQELIAKQPGDNSTMRRKKKLNYLSCCIGA
ncbi:hypothetical protein RJ639_037098 [Escallonia herrerae]|uniref:RIN4 pathogenic type III effector avirulence factor Avr cleavage site domain-containing protein n=2 Tax=Escallonia TaxID=23075 RepID=A0AA88REY1_9ASTE|nr:hypothetical protein RJ640_018188 [Escallonia rubra]KAK3032380.1 hypothetical protein RJ639_037098 [Escallonia herrerae]